MYCPTDHATCPPRCSAYLTGALRTCPGISAGLSADDRAFMQTQCHKTDAPTAAPAPPAAAGTGIYALSAVDIEGNEIQFSQFMGKVTLFVNVAQF